VHLDGILLGELVGDEKRRDVLALVTLQLEHLAEILVLNNGAVAAVLYRRGGRLRWAA
jgi:hypothetical protein